MATGFARALTRENSVPGQLTRKGMSSLSWGSARPPPDASRRPQRTNNTGPPGTRLRAPPPPSSILHRRFLQPPTQAPLPQRRGGGGGGGGVGGGTTKTPKQPGAQPPPRLLPESPATPPLPRRATRHSFRGRRHINIRGRRGPRLRKPRHPLGYACFSRPQFRREIGRRFFASETPLDRASDQSFPQRSRGSKSR